MAAINVHADDTPLRIAPRQRDRELATAATDIKDCRLIRHDVGQLLDESSAEAVHPISNHLVIQPPDQRRADPRYVEA
ncbi:hypothetical protein A5782_03295 [Mycobacterium sp. 852002-40037_SCH5390672]|nr:hypothetical protein A5782_03295 [Mycobacterium sp. 852002-40037_SCH5390672]